MNRDSVHAAKKLSPYCTFSGPEWPRGVGWSAFDWADHCLKKERGINEDDICVSYVWRQWQLG